MKRIFDRRYFLAATCILLLVLALNVSAAGSEVAKEITIHGRLSRTVEAGGWLIRSGKKKFLILNAAKFKNNSWFRAGVRVEAVGETKPGRITIYMEGIPFKVRSLRTVPQKKRGAFVIPVRTFGVTVRMLCFPTLKTGSTNRRVRGSIRVRRSL